MSCRNGAAVRRLARGTASGERKVGHGWLVEIFQIKQLGRDNRRQRIDCHQSRHAVRFL